MHENETASPHPLFILDQRWLVTSERNAGVTGNSGDKDEDSRVFRKLTKLAIMAILASEALLREKIQ